MLPSTASASRPACQVVAIATSAGGIPALHTILALLPPTIPAAVLVVQHLMPHRDSHLVEVLRLRSRLEVTQARVAQRPLEGVVYVAPPDAHMVVRINRRLALSHLPPVHYCRPSGDCLFESLPPVFGAAVVAVVLTGFGRDGAVGAQCVRRAGGTVIVEDPTTAQHGDMPRAALRAGAVDHVLPLRDIAAQVIEQVSAGALA